MPQTTDPNFWMVVGVIVGWALGVGTMVLLAWIDRKVCESFRTLQRPPAPETDRAGDLCGCDGVTNQLCPHAPTEYAGFCTCLTCNGCGRIDEEAMCPTCDGRGILP